MPGRSVPVGAAVAGLVLGAALVACDPGPDAAVPDLPTRIAVRAEADRLELWTGRPCTAVQEIDVTLDPGAETPLGVLEYVASEPTAVERFDLTDPPAGFEVATALPAGVSWRDAETLLVVLTLADGKRSVRADLRGLPDARGRYRLGSREVTGQEVLAGEGEDHEPVCAPG